MVLEKKAPSLLFALPLATPLELLRRALAVGLVTELLRRLCAALATELVKDAVAENTSSSRFLLLATLPFDHSVVKLA